MPSVQSRNAEPATAAFVLTLLAGLWMLGSAGMMHGFGWGMMSGAYGGASAVPHMGRWMWGSGFMAMGPVTTGFGLAGGVVLLVGATMLYLRPSLRRTWGIVIVIVSAVEIVAMGGMLAGVLGVIGGSLAWAGGERPGNQAHS